MEEAKRGAERLLSRFRIHGEIVFHEKSGKTTEEAEKALGIDRGHILKCLLFRSRRRCVAAIILGDKRVDLKKLKRISQSKSLRLATRAEVKELTGYKVGGVPPFVVFNVCQTFIDNDVMKRSFVVGAGGSEYVGIKFSPQEFNRFNMTVANLTEDLGDETK